MKNRKALVVLSGGQDSTTCLLWAIDKFGKENVSAIGFDYGQRHKLELECADKICKKVGIPYEIVPTPIINQLSANSLTREDIPVEETKPEGAPPNTFVEGRNLLFLSYAAIYAKTHGITDLVTGVCETDFSGYPDCRDIFVKSLNVTINLAMDYNFVIHTPLMWLKLGKWLTIWVYLTLFTTKHLLVITAYSAKAADTVRHARSEDAVTNNIWR